MSALQIEERIRVSAAPGRVWKFILDPARVAGCLPGARLDGTEGDKTFLGTMKVKVGPVLMEFKGKATMSEVVADERRVTLTGTGNDKSGGGSAKMDMRCQILEAEGGGSEIVVKADVDLAGKLVRFGRGMMEGISKQLFKQFSERVRAELEGEVDDEGEEDEPAAATPAPAEAPQAAAPEAPAAEPPKEALPAPQAPPPEPPKEAPPAPQEPPPEPPEATPPEPQEQPTRTLEQAAPVDKPSPERSKIDARPTAETPPASTEEAPTPAEGAPTPAEEARAPETPAPVRKKKKKAAPRKAALVPADDAPLDAGSIVWAAIWAWIKGLLSRIFGKKG
jgi:carbon monoxide dehydrogenase subunit G